MEFIILFFWRGILKQLAKIHNKTHLNNSNIEGVSSRMNERLQFLEYRIYVKMLNSFGHLKWEGHLPLLCDFWNIVGKYSRDKGYYSQCGQDRFVSMLLGDEKLKMGGVFLDIGGNKPIAINNTYYFETMGWKGLAFEPMEKYNIEWKEKRTTKCLNIALGDEDKEVEFLEYSKDYLTHRSDIDDGASVRAVESEGADIVKKIKVRQRRLNNVLDEYNMHEIDYCSMDIEGCELEVLKSIDFEKNRIRIFTIENEDDLDSIFAVRKFMHQQGYWLIARLGDQDDVFVDSSVFSREKLS